MKFGIVNEPSAELRDIENENQRQLSISVYLIRIYNIFISSSCYCGAFMGVGLPSIGGSGGNDVLGGLVMS